MSIKDELTNNRRDDYCSKKTWMTCWPRELTNVEEILTLFYTFKQRDRDQMGERRTWEAF